MGWRDPLTVGELRSMLEGVDDDLEVYLQKDPEGNGYEYARGAEEALSIEDEGTQFPAPEAFEEGEIDPHDVTKRFLIYP